ncbi:MAG: hypothetical protein ABIK86_03380 [candidate division WOR-3 bacterium]
MRGPYALRPLQVDISVPCRVGGVYCLGREPRQITYIGRAERDLREALKAHAAEYLYFWYEPALTPREAFITQCYEYHRHADRGGLKDVSHPVAPDRVEQKCPVCGK